MLLVTSVGSLTGNDIAIKMNSEDANESFGSMSAASLQLATDVVQ